MTIVVDLPNVFGDSATVLNMNLSSNLGFSIPSTKTEIGVLLFLQVYQLAWSYELWLDCNWGNSFLWINPSVLHVICVRFFLASPKLSDHSFFSVCPWKINTLLSSNIFHCEPYIFHSLWLPLLALSLWDAFIKLKFFAILWTFDSNAHIRLLVLKQSIAPVLPNLLVYISTLSNLDCGSNLWLLIFDSKTCEWISWWLFVHKFSNCKDFGFLRFLRLLRLLRFSRFFRFLECQIFIW